MAKFSTEVYKLCRDLISKHGFHAAKAMAGQRFASLVFRYSQDICYYVFIRDERRGSGSVNAQLWVTLPDAPVDVIDKLGVGFKIDLGATYEPDDEFIKNIARRVEILLPALEGIAKVVQTEFENPIFKTERLTKYRIERLAFEAIRKYSMTSAGSYCRPVFEKALSVASGKSKFQELETACVEMAERLLQESPALPEINNDYFEGRPDFIGFCLADHFYIEALAPVLS